MKNSYLFLADGFEITEAMAPLDIIRRAGIKIKTVSIKDEKTVISSHKIPVVADLNWTEFQELAKESGNEFQLLVFPGGMPGSSNLASCEQLMTIMNCHFDKGGLVAAICAAPSVVLSKLNDVSARFMCCYEGFENRLIEVGAKVIKEKGVVTDGNIITSRGAGHAIDFGLALVKAAVSPEEAEKVAKEIML